MLSHLRIKVSLRKVAKNPLIMASMQKLVFVVIVLVNKKGVCKYVKFSYGRNYGNTLFDVYQ